MAIQWGSWEGSGNAMRVGIDVDWEDVTVGETAATVTVRYYTQNNYSWGDNQTMRLGGHIDGSVDYYNGQGDGVVERRATRTYTYTYSSTSYGTSPGTRTFSAAVSGAYNGITPSKSVTTDIPARPITDPLAPTGAAVTRISDTSQRVTWTNRHSVSRPWTRVYVQQSVNGGAYATIATLGSTAAAYTATTSANNRYTYRVASQNSEGTSAWSTTGVVYTSPTVPFNVTRTDEGGGQRINWDTPVARYTQYVAEVWARKNGSSTLLKLNGDISPGVETFLHTAATSPNPYTATDQWSYLVRHRTSDGPAVYSSSLSNETTTSAGVTAPPLAPTSLAPNSTTIDSTRVQPFSWLHVSAPGFLSSQTAFKLRYRISGTETWSPDVTGTTSSSWVAPPSTFVDGQSYEWQVSTKGADVEYSPYSDSASFITAVAPIAADPIKIPLQLDAYTGQIEASATASETRDFIMRAQSQLLGGGTKSVSTGYAISWTDRFIASGLGRSGVTFPNGQHDIRRPYGWNIAAGSAVAAGSATIKLNLALGPNKMRVGEYITVVSSSIPELNATDHIVRATTSDSVVVDLPVSDQAISTTGSVFPKIFGYAGASNRYSSGATTPLNAWEALYYEVPFGWGSGSTPRKNGVVAVSNKAQQSTTMTLTVGTPHYFAVGDTVNVSIGDVNADGARILTAVTAVSISFPVLTTATFSTPATGLVNPSGRDTFFGNFRVVSHTSGSFVVPANWLLIAVRNGDSGRVEWVTGENMAADTQQGGGWVSLTYNAGWSGTIAYRVIGDVVYLRGEAERASGTGTVIGTLPSYAWPTQSASYMARMSSTSTPFSISTNGNMNISNTYYNTGELVYVDGLSFLNS